jgi:hypothetical protein
MLTRPSHEFLVSESPRRAQTTHEVAGRRYQRRDQVARHPGTAGCSCGIVRRREEAQQAGLLAPAHAGRGAPIPAIALTTASRATTARASCPVAPTERTPGRCTPPTGEARRQAVRWSSRRPRHRGSPKAAFECTSSYLIFILTYLVGHDLMMVTISWIELPIPAVQYLY